MSRNRAIKITGLSKKVKVNTFSGNRHVSEVHCASKQGERKRKRDEERLALLKGNEYLRNLMSSQFSPVQSYQRRTII